MSYPVYGAEEQAQDSLKVATTVGLIDPDEYEPDGIDSALSEAGRLTDFASTVISVIRIIGIIVTVITLLIIGIKYMTSSIEERAEYKKSMIPYLIGVKTKFTDVIHEKADRMIGIRFRPCAISAFTQVPIYEFNDCRINTDLFPSLFSDFKPEKLIRTSNRISQLEHIDNYLLSKLGYLHDINKQIIYIAEYIQVTKGIVPINELLNKVCLSQRQFERKFKDLTGMTPKMFSAITRFSTAEKFIRFHPDKSLFTIALDCGYYDHSHLIREFKRFSGVLPQMLMSNLYTTSPLFPYYLCASKK